MADIELVLDSDPSLVLDSGDNDIELQESAPAGGGRTKDYNQLENKPSINNITLEGNHTTEELIPELSDKADKTDTVLLTTLSRGRTGGTAVGVGSVAFGEDVAASGECAVATGISTIASGEASHTEGTYTTASGDDSHAEGYMNEASGQASHSEGYMTLASGSYSHTEGAETEATGSYAHAEGNRTYAFGNGAHAEGKREQTSTTFVYNSATHTYGATGDYSHSEGRDTTAEGHYSHAEGNDACAFGAQSHAEGNGSKAIATSSHAEGGGTLASGLCSHSEGGDTSASGEASHAEGSSTSAYGNYSHAEGKSTHAQGRYSHAENLGTLAYGEHSHAEGYYAIAHGNGSHAEGIREQTSTTFTYNGSTHTFGATNIATHSEGYDTAAAGEYSHAEGHKSKAIGHKSHAEGGGTVAAGDLSHAEGGSTTASGDNSHAEGSGSTATTFAAHAEGGGAYATGVQSHAEGGGTIASGTNAHAEGSGTVASNYQAHAEGGGTHATGVQAHAEGGGTTASGESSHAEGIGAVAFGMASHAEGRRGPSSTTFSYNGTTYNYGASGESSHSEGFNTAANGNHSHAENGYTRAIGLQSHAEGSGSLAFGSVSHAEGLQTTALGANAHAEGSFTIATGNSSHAEGAVGATTFTYNGSTYTRGATGNRSHSEGYNATAWGDNSHSEGNSTIALGANSHAEGNETVASDSASHAEGYGTISSGAQAHAEGGGTHATAYASHSEGGGTTASGPQSHAEGGGTTASGANSHAEGAGTQATGPQAHAEGASSKATGAQSHAEGTSTTASGVSSHAEGFFTYAEDYAAHAEGGNTHANAPMSHAEGGNTIAAGTYSHVGGTMNVEDSYDNWPEWVSGSEYSVGDKVKITTTSGNDTTITAYICKTANSDTTFTAYKWDNQQGKMNYAEIIGNGISSRSNARALDWDGNERLAGNLYVGCESDSTGGNKVATEAFVTGKIGSANGIAGLDSAGKVPSSQLPSYVDDVLEYASIAEFPVTGESGKIYVALDTNKTYRWGGTAYVQISESLALGETDQTAYRGDRGKAAYDHAMLKGTEHTAGFYKIGTNSEGHVVTATQVTKNDIVSLGIAPAIMDSEVGYNHTNVDSFTINGNQYAFGNAKYANKKNLIVGYDREFSPSGMSVIARENFVLINGTASGANDIGVWTDDTVDIPAGSYTFKVEPYVGNSALTNGKKMHLDLWYDGNTSSTQDLRVSLTGVKDVAVSSTFTLSDHVYKIRVWTGYTTNVYDGYRLYYSLLPSDTTIVDTGETISASGSLEVTLVTELSVVDTLMHKSTVQAVIDTKTYVDNHIPDVDFVCFRPEDYGAKGDGSTDDSTALQACITAAQAYDYSKGKCIRGYGTYYLGTGIVFNCRELDVFINKIIYGGNDAAVTISASYSKFVFQSIRAIAGGSSAVGIKCYQTANDIFYHNEIRCSYIRTNGNTVLIAKSNDVVTDSMMYNQFYFKYQWSVNANIIEIATQSCNENNFYGRLVRALNGYLVHFAQGCFGGLKLFNYCLENEVCNGTNGNVKFYNCRFSEMQNLQTTSEHTKGFVYRWEDCTPAGEIVDPTAGINLTAVDVTNADSWYDCLDKVKAAYDAGATDYSEPWSRNIPSASGNYPFFAMISPVTCVANANMTTNGGSVHIPEGKMIVYYNNIAYKPNCDIYQLVSSDMTILLSDQNDWNYITPTIFDIDAASVTITLDASYCCLAINEFDVIQHTGKEAIVVDKLGNTIFDGTGLGEGVFHFKCSMVQYGYHELYITTTGGTVKYCPTGIAKSIYSGLNEKWTVTKEELIE